MISFTRLLLAFCLPIFVAHSGNRIHAQVPDEAPSCFIDLGDIVFPFTTICANEPFNVPCVDFQTTEPGPAGVMWVVYSEQPVSTNPLSDPGALLYNAILSDPNSNPIYGCSQPALFENLSILTPGVSEVCVYLVPVINNDTTNTAPGTCSGVVPGFNYPLICFLNPEENPEICDSNCGGVTEDNDNCPDATSFVIAPATYGVYSNVCSTSIDDPTGVPNSCFGSDPYQATVWFTFTGNGGTYTISTINCPGSANPQIADSQMAIYTGNCGALTLAACNDDQGANLLASINNFATVAGQVYYILVDGYEDARGEFCLQALEIVAPPVCDADYGAVSPASPAAICQTEGITFTATGAASGGYTSYFVVVNTATGNIVISNVATTFTLLGSAVGAGNFTVHALNISNDDLSAITPFPATAAALATALANPDVCADFDAAGIAVAVTATPNATALSNSPLCEGESIQLFGSTSTPGSATYSWTGPGGFTASVQNPQIDNATTAQGGTYILTVSINGCQSAPVLVSVLVNPIPAVTAGSNSPICENDPLNLSASTSATGTVTYLWNGPGGYTAFTQNPVINPATIANSGTYSVTAVANGCSSAPATTEVVVNEQPSLLLEASDSTPCTGTCFTISAVNASGGTVTWVGPNGFTSNNTVIEFCDAESAISGSYCASVLLNGCESQLACIDVTVLLPDDPACAELCLASGGLVTTDDNTICPDETLVTQAVGTTGGAYQTYYLLADSFGNILANQTSGSFSGLASGSYNVYALNFAAADAGLVDAFLAGGADISALQNAINNPDFCAALSDALNILVLAETSVGCFNCQADGGTVTYTGAEVQVCQNAITAPFNFTANNTNAGYLTYLVVTDATTTQIIAYTSQNTIDWAVLGLSAGSYTVYAINIADAFQADIETALTSGLTWADFLTAIGGSGYCFDVSDGTTQFIVIAADVSPCAETCFANFGTVIPPADTDLCPDETAQPATLVGAATSGYTTAYLVTTPNGGSLTVVGLYTTSEFTCPDAGTYLIHALNYANIDAVAVQSAVVPNADVSSTLINLAAANVCYELDLNGYALNCLPANNLACLPPLAVINVVETPAPDGLTYTVSFTVTGGSGVYIINGNPSGSNFVSSSIPCGVAYNFEITDDVASGVLIVSGVSPCVCPTNPGNMPNFTSAAPVCWGGSITLTSLNPVLIPGDVLIYVLHNGTASTVGTILATSPTGSFNFASSPLLTTNTTYYITPIAGPTDANGDLIFADPCTRTGTGAPIVFLEPITFTINENCDWMTGDYTVVLFPAGGLPQFDSSQTYQITGDVAVNIGYGQSVVHVFPQNETTIYSFTISDNTCTDAVTATEPFVCIKTPIQLLTFKGEVQQHGNLLQWTTATETDNDFFALERSIDAVHFSRIAVIDGAGTSITTKKYDYLDKECPAGTVYYRLVQVDFNGSTTTSQVISLKRPEATFGFNAIYPVPAERFVEIAFSAETDAPVSIEVYDLVGKLVSSVGVFAQSGNNVYVLPVAELPAGMYLLSINNGNKVISNRFVKK